MQPEAPRPGDNFETIQIEIADDQRNEDTLGTKALREFLQLRLIETPARICGAFLKSINRNLAEIVPD